MSQHVLTAHGQQFHFIDAHAANGLTLPGGPTLYQLVKLCGVTIFIKATQRKNATLNSRRTKSSAQKTNCN